MNTVLWISKDIRNLEQLDGVMITSFSFVSSSEGTSGFLLSQYLPVQSSVHKHWVQRDVLCLKCYQNYVLEIGIIIFLVFYVVNGKTFAYKEIELNENKQKLFKPSLTFTICSKKPKLEKAINCKTFYVSDMNTGFIAGMSRACYYTSFSFVWCSAHPPAADCF